MRWVEIREVVQMTFWCGVGFAGGCVAVYGFLFYWAHLVRWVVLA